jgi:hypothetical protein
MHTQSQRAAEWGHWGITFYWQTPGQYAPDKIEGILYFPVSNGGPCDMPGRERYKAIIGQWRETGALPEGLKQL